MRVRGRPRKLWRRARTLHPDDRSGPGLAATRRRLPVHHITIQDTDGRKSVALDLEVDGAMTTSTRATTAAPRRPDRARYGKKAVNESYGLQ